MSAEDEADTTIVPTLEASGADMERCIIRDFKLGEDMALDDHGFEIIRRAADLHAPRLVLVDPVVSFLGGKIDMHRSNEVRPMMAKLAQLARHYNCSVCVIAHINKNEGQKPGARVAGSMDFRNAARSQALAGRDDEERDRGCLFIHDKVNGAKEGPPLGYRIDDSGCAVWEENDLTRADCFGGGSAKKQPPKRETVSAIIVAYLQLAPDHRAPSSDVKTITKAALPAVSTATISRGQDDSGVAYDRHPAGSTEWVLP